jgi:capsular polysaccharide biosynthesis protein
VRIPWWSAVLVSTAIGAGIGAAVAAAGHVDYTAEAKVVVQAKAGPAAIRALLPNVRELATSSLLAGNVDSTLRLPGSTDDLQRRLHASVAPASQVIVLRLSDSDRDRARQIAQESAVVLTQLVPARFRTPPLQAAVLDPAHVVAQHGRHFWRDALIGAAIGLVVALAAVLARRGLPAAAPADEKVEAREQALKERVELLTRRERELARRAGEVAKRERAAADLEAQAGASLEAARAKAVEPAPPPEPAPAPVEAPPPAAPVVDGSGLLPTLGELELLVQARRADAPERAQEWADYLFYLREHAGPDGRLPGHFSGLVQDVFGDLLR